MSDEVEMDFFGRQVRTGHGQPPTEFQATIARAVFGNWLTTMLKKLCSGDLGDLILRLAKENAEMGGPFIDFRNRNDQAYALICLYEASERLEKYLASEPFRSSPLSDKEEEVERLMALSERWDL